MRRVTSIALVSTVCLASLLAACGGSDGEGEGEDVDAEGCEHLTEGPYVSTAAATEKVATAPAVGADHMAYSLSLPAGAPGYVTFAADAAGDVVFFLDQDVPFRVYSSSGTEEPLEESATSSPACGEVKGRHVAALAVGTHILEIGAATGIALVNLVIEEAGGHAE